MHILPYPISRSPKAIIETLDKMKQPHSFTSPIPLNSEKIDIYTYRSRALENS
jgi:hypothetical protein